jgi:hypothetical protein
MLLRVQVRRDNVDGRQFAHEGVLAEILKSQKSVTYYKHYRKAQQRYFCDFFVFVDLHHAQARSRGRAYDEP